MSTRYEMAAQPRDRAGKGVARALRRDNLVPSVIYGDNKDPILLSLTEKEITKEYNTGSIFTNLCELSLDGKEHLVLARDVQRHPVTDRVIHVDFLEVDLSKSIRTQVPIVLVGESPAVRLHGGIVSQLIYSLEIDCLPKDMLSPGKSPAKESRLEVVADFQFHQIQQFRVIHHVHLV